MHEVLRQRLLRRIESLPESQVYQVLDFIEFLESKYARDSQPVEPSVLQKFAEGLEDRMRKKAMNPATLREAFQLIAAADRVLADVSTAGKQIMTELGGLADPPPPASPRKSGSGPGASSSSGSSSSGSSPSSPSSGQRGGDRGGRHTGGRQTGTRDAGRGDTRKDVGLGEEWTDRGGSGESGGGRSG